MSNPNPPPYPPPLPGTPYGGGQPSYGYKPYEEPTRVSGLAVASLIVSLIACIPFLTSLLGVTFGIAGIVSTSNPKRSGRLLAVFGLLLGLLGLVGWSAASYTCWKRYVEPAYVALTFQEHLRTNDIASAAKLTAPPFDNARLSELSATMQSLGKFQTLNGAPRRASTRPLLSANKIVLPFNVQFENGMAEVVVGVERSAGDWHVTLYDLHYPPHGPSTMPSSMPSSMPSLTPAWGPGGPGSPGDGGRGPDEGPGGPPMPDSPPMQPAKPPATP